MELDVEDVGAPNDYPDCPFCNESLLRETELDSEDEWVSGPSCMHVFLVANDVGITYMSDAAIHALHNAGIRVTVELDGVDIESDDETETWNDIITPICHSLSISGRAVTLGCVALQGHQDARGSTAVHTGEVSV